MAHPLILRVIYRAAKSVLRYCKLFFSIDIPLYTLERVIMKW